MSVKEHAREIETMEVRGAGAIARHATAALATWARDAPGDAGFEDAFRAHVERLRRTRPTAVSLRNALDVVVRAVDQEGARPEVVVEAAEGFVERSRDAVERLGELHRDLVADADRVLTHCNSQAVRSVLRAGRDAGEDPRVLATETRPWGQGYVTVRELAADGIRSAFIVDNAVHRFLPDVDVVLVGADSVARNGDVVNKIGTAGLALACHHHDVPLHVCAETYKVDLEAPTGDDVPIEERDPTEVADPADLPEGVDVLNPVFDVASADHVRSIATEEGAVAPSEVADLAASIWR